MRKFVFRFQALLRYREHQRDLCRQLLAGVLADESNLISQGNRLETTRQQQFDELRQLGQPGEVDVDKSASRRYYAGQLLGDMRQLQRQRDVVSQQLQLCRQALVKADQQVKVLEKLEERQRAEFRYFQERQAAKQLEDEWLAVRAKDFSR